MNYLDMTNTVYELAKKCKDSSDKEVTMIMRRQGGLSVPFAVNIKGTQFQENVSALVSEIDIRYPLMANDLRRHLSQYSGNPIQHQESIDTIIDYLIEVEGRFANRPRKIFISHKSEDSAFATELIKLLRLYIGLDPSLIFCSSVPGYEIDLGKKFFPEIKKQFDENEVLVIIIHSPRYYQSSICLNEMGAAWIMDAEHYSFLTADCDFSQLKGVIEDKEIAIKVNASDAKSRMNAFLQKVLQFLGMPECDYTDHRVLSRWEDDRDAFLSAVSKI